MTPNIDFEAVEADLEAKKRRGREAKELLANPLLQGAFADLEKMLQAKALECDSDDKDMAWRIVLTQKLFRQLKDGIEILVQRGNDASLALTELEKKRSWWAEKTRRAFKR